MSPKRKRVGGGSSAGIVIPGREAGKIRHEEKESTLPSPSRTDPIRKRTEPDMRRYRVVVVSPYQKLNAYYSFAIPELFKGADVDVIFEAETREPPYFDIKKYEIGRPVPYSVIDFGKIIGLRPSPFRLIEGRKKILLENIGQFFNRAIRHKLNLDDFADRFGKELDNFSISEEVSNLLSGLSLNDKEIEEIREKFELSDAQVSKNHTVRRPIDFPRYNVYVKRNYRKTPCLVPTISFMTFLKDSESYDKEGNFDQDSISPRHLSIEKLERDIEAMVQEDYNSLRLFEVDSG